MKKIILIIGATILFSSCGKELTDLNIDQKHPSSVPAYALFTSSQKTLADNMASTNVNSNIWRLLVQHWQETTYTDESNYDLTTRNISNQVWAYHYRDVLKNLADAKSLIKTQTVDTNQRKVQTAMIDVLECYTYSILVNTFGDVPYTKAIDASNITPTYDKASAIYTDLFARLQKDAAVLKTGTSSGEFAGADLLFGGDVTKWFKFTNSLLLKYAVLLDDYDHANSSKIATAVKNDVITSSSDNAIFQYLSSTPNTNPVWVDLIQSGRHDFVGCKTLINKLLALNDPRLPFYFDKIGTTYKGGTPGASSSFSSYSSPGALIQDPTLSHIFMDVVDVEFLMAEAIERGMISGTASTHYNNAITASIVYWGATAADATAYLANAEVVYGAKPWKEQIGTQKWIALYNRGFDAWTEQRRLDFPALLAPSTARSAYPVRFTYPTNEQNLNATNWTAASASIGGDLVTTKLFWDKF